MKNKIILSGLIIVFIAIIAGMISFAKTVSDKDRVHTIGVIAPLSGPAGTIGEGMKRALDMAPLKNLTLAYQDDQCNAGKAISAYQSMREQGIHVYVVACSGSVMALAPLMKQNGDFIITAYAGSDLIRQTGPEVIHPIPDAVDIMASMAKVFDREEYAGPANATSTGATSTKKIALLYEVQDYATSAAGVLKKKLGDKIVIEETYLPTDTSFATQIAKIKAAKPDLIAYIPVTEKNTEIVLKEISKVKIMAPIVSEVNLCGFAFTFTTPNIHGTCLIQQLPQNTEKTFAAAYKARWNIDSAYPANDASSYDSLVAMDDLIGKGADTPDELQAALIDGFTAPYARYDFTPNGKVIDQGFFVEKKF